jgi:hypothetical protein
MPIVDILVEGGQPLLAILNSAVGDPIWKIHTRSDLRPIYNPVLVVGVNTAQRCPGDASEQIAPKIMGRLGPAGNEFAVLP